MPNRTAEKIERFNSWLEAAGRDGANTLSRAEAAWKSLPVSTRMEVLHRIGFLCSGCNRMPQAGKTVCRKCEAEGKEKQDKQAAGEKKVGKKSGKTVKDHAGHRPKGKKGREG